MAGRRPWARMAVALTATLAAACYTYRPVTATPAPEMRLALVLNDVGRVGAASAIGPAAARVEGTLVAAADTGYVLRVSAVEGITGTRQRWAGEIVTLRSDYVASVLERRFAKGRTVAAVVGIGGTLLGLILTRGLGVVGGGDGGNGPPGNGGGEQ